MPICMTIPEIAHKWGAERTPEFYLLDGQGKIVYRGRLDNSPRDPTMATTSELVDAMDSLSMGEDQSGYQNPIYWLLH